MPKKGKIKIDIELCKACGLCIEFCSKNSIEFGDDYNAKGYTPVRHCGEECTGCAICALMCPEAAIEVWRD